MLEYARPLVASRTEHDCRWTFLSHACGRLPLLVTRFFQQFAWNRGVVRIAPFTSFSPFCERRHIIISLSCLSVCVAFEVTVTSLHPPRLCRIAVFSIKPTFLFKKKNKERQQRKESDIRWGLKDPESGNVAQGRRRPARDRGLPLPNDGRKGFTKKTAAENLKGQLQGSSVMMMMMFITIFAGD